MHSCLGLVGPPVIVICNFIIGSEDITPQPAAMPGMMTVKLRRYWESGAGQVAGREEEREGIGQNKSISQSVSQSTSQPVSQPKKLPEFF